MQNRIVILLFFISLIETFLSRCCTLSDLETRNKSQLTEKNIFIHSQGSKLSLSVSKSLKWLSEALIDFATTWVSSLPLYLFILQLFTLSLLQFDFILEMREKNVEKCYLEVYTAYNSGKGGRIQFEVWHRARMRSRAANNQDDGSELS